MFLGAMIARNERTRYIVQSLRALASAVDKVLVLDDASTDGTDEVCRQLGAEVRRRTTSGFANEWQLRAELWDWASSLGPEWIVVLDADEVLRGGEHLRAILRALDRFPLVGAVAVRLWDLWDDEGRARDDELWTAHRRYWTIAMRWTPRWTYQWLQWPQHCGRLPLNPPGWIVQIDDVDVLHYGWLRREDRVKKYARYRQLDPHAWWGSADQYRSILDDAPQTCPVPPLGGGRP